ncbi:MAG: lipolytic protein family [Segetibacter sp.]|nr:lipolytic protein family [Segetibacter sp.]
MMKWYRKPGLSLLMIILFCSFFFIEKKKTNIVFIGDSITEGGGLKDKTTDAAPVKAVEYLRKEGKLGKVDFSNQGVSGYTTVDFLPSAGKAFSNVIKAADNFIATRDGLLFSLMLGTNDSAMDGPNGAPVSPQSYGRNLKIIIDTLLKRYPGSKVIIHHPIWYSPTTYNRSRYLDEGLKRLQSYFPVITAIVTGYTKTNRGHVFFGDEQGFNFFEKHFKEYMLHETGKAGIFYLHPNEKGASQLGVLWGKAITKALSVK